MLMLNWMGKLESAINSRSLGRDVKFVHVSFCVFFNHMIFKKSTCN
jgi:hypothetical protein